MWTPARIGLALFGVLLTTSHLEAVVVPPTSTFVPIIPDSFDTNRTRLAVAEHPFNYTDTVIVPGPGGSTNSYSFTGFVREQVWREDATGTLDFYYQYVVTNRTNQGIQAQSFYPGAIERLTILGIDPAIPTDVHVQNTTGLFYPQQAFRSPDGTLEFLNFNPSQFNLPVGSDTTARQFFIHTDATEFDSGGTLFSLFSVGNRATFEGERFEAFRPIFGSGTGLPEPLSLLTLPLALAALAFRRPRANSSLLPR